MITLSIPCYYCPPSISRPSLVSEASSCRNEGRSWRQDSGKATTLQPPASSTSVTLPAYPKFPVPSSFANPHLTRSRHIAFRLSYPACIEFCRSVNVRALRASTNAARMRFTILPLLEVAALLLSAITISSAEDTKKCAADYFVKELPGQPPGPLIKMHAGLVLCLLLLQNIWSRRSKDRGNC